MLVLARVGEAAHLVVSMVSPANRSTSRSLATARSSWGHMGHIVDSG